jgi:hypothetical protein
MLISYDMMAAADKAEDILGASAYAMRLDSNLHR